MKLSTSKFSPLGLVLLCLHVAGCRSGEEQANENALKARNAQFSEMNKQGSSGSATPKGSDKNGDLNPPKLAPGSE